MLNKLKSQKGSSFVYVLIVITILTLLSGTIVTMTVANYKLGITKGGRNTAFYFADGAIDEALAEIEEISHRAEILASAEIQNEDAEFKKTDKWVDFEKWLDSQQDSDDLVTGIEDSSEDNYLTSEEVTAIYDEALNREYTKQYLMALMGATEDDIDVDYTLLKDAEDEDKDDTFEEKFNLKFKNVDGLKESYTKALTNVVFDPNGSESFEDIKLSMTKVESTYYDDEGEDASDGSDDKKAIRVTLQSSGKYNIYNKEVEVVVDMVPPKHDYLTVTSVKRKTLITNELLENSMTAKQDIIIVGGNVEAKGDVYALGTFDDSINVTYADKGGIIVGYDESNHDFLNIHDLSNANRLNLNAIIDDKGSLNVTGNIKTAASVKPNKSESKISVEGALHADSFIVSKDAINTQTTIKDSMFLMDDLYIAADDTSIIIGKEGYTYDPENVNIDESFITYLDGVDVDSDNMSLNNPDLSSSVRVDKNASDVKFDTDSFYVPGVAYINVYRNEVDSEGNVVKKYYQTGESFTAEKNFFFYQEKIEDQEERTIEVTYTDGTNDFELVEYVNSNGDLESGARYKADHFLNRVRNEYEKDAAVRDDEIVTTGDKKIMTIRSMERDAYVGDDLEKYPDNYALGVFLANGRIYNPISGLSFSSAKFRDYIKRPSNLISDLYMNQLGYRDYRRGKTITTIDQGTEQVEMLDAYIDFSKSNEFETINTSGRLLVLDDSSNADVYINVPTADIPANSEAIIYNGSNAIKGLVATKGDIYIYNDKDSPNLEFTGSLIAGGSIVFYGEGTKTINNYDPNLNSKTIEGKIGKTIASHAKVYSLVGSSTLLTDAFHVLEGRKLIAEFKDGSKKDYTRSIHFNLDLDIVDKNFGYIKDQPMPAQVDISMMSTPELEGSSKEEAIKGYELVYWREI